MARHDAATCLLTALRLARQYRWVSDWLFTTPWKPFHTALILPPPSLDAGITLRVRRKLRPHLLDTTEMCIEFDCFFMPVAYVSPTVVGYMLGANGKTANSDVIHHDNPFDPPFKGRFAYDTRAKEMLRIVQKRVDAPLGVHMMRLDRESALDQCVFVVPCGAYCFERLPCECISMFYSAEYRGESIGDGGIEESDETSLAVTDQLLPAARRRERLDELTRVEDGCTSFLPWIVSKDGLSDGGCIALNPVQMETSSSAFCYDKLLRCISSFRRFCCGRFYVPTTRMDVSQGGVGLCSLYGGKGFRDCKQVERRMIQRMKRLFADSYFGAVLDVAIDERLSGTEMFDETEISNNALEGGEELLDLAIGHGVAQTFGSTDYYAPKTCEDAGNRVVGHNPAEEVWATGVAETRRRPRRAALIAPARKAGAAVERPALPPNESKEERQARVAAERRQRNRVTAARSNERKRERIESMQREIKENLETVKRLEGRKEVLSEENERLREMVGMVDGGE